jgi:hypothetical protein
MVCKTFAVYFDVYICINYYNTVMPSVMYPARKDKVDDLGFLRTPDRLLGLCGLCVQQSEVNETMTGAHRPYKLGGSSTASIGACHYIGCCSTTL